jgi:hypothetical protein
MRIRRKRGKSQGERCWNCFARRRELWFTRPMSPLDPAQVGTLPTEAPGL